MSALHLPAVDVPTVAARRTLASVDARTTVRGRARQHVTDVLRLVALSIDANASSGAARAAKYARLHVLVAEVSATAATAVSAEVAAELRGLDADAGLTPSADRIVALLGLALAPQDVAIILREVVTTRWADGQRMQSDPAVALGYAARLLSPSTTTQELTDLRRPGFVRRLFPHRAPATTTRDLHSVAPVRVSEPTWREPGEPVVPGVLFLPLAAQAAARVEAGRRPLVVVPSDGFSAA